MLRCPRDDRWKDRRLLSAVLVGVLLDGITDGWVVHNGQELGEVLGEHLEVQNLVAVVHLLQQEVAGEIIGKPLQLRPEALRLLLQCQDRRRQSPGQAECLPFGFGEPSALVDCRCG